MHTGKKARLARLTHRHSGRFLIVPMDHGFTLGPIPGLVDMNAAVMPLGGDSGLVQAVVLHRGVIEHLTQTMPLHMLPPRMLHVSASTALRPNSNLKMIVAGIEEALMLGVDGVSVHVNLGDDVEPQMLRDFGSLASECQRWGMPLLAMMYVRRQGSSSRDVADLKLAARAAAEMGADLVKVSYPGSVQKMQEVVDGCFVPVLIAGGEKASTREAVQLARDAVAGGAAGVCMGRNLFQSSDAAAVLHAVAEGVHGPVYETPTRRETPALVAA
ncbi:MAG: fructose-bisphosphate aldolase [Ramlibacter sp.]|nr:fructose-bisphosphate aldolase [Ramlibacter sp.]